MVALFLSLALAADPGAEDPAFAPYGHRITAVGGGPGVSLGEAGAPMGKSCASIRRHPLVVRSAMAEPMAELTHLIEQRRFSFEVDDASDGSQERSGGFV